jgi:hypothetical protein
MSESRSQSIPRDILERPFPPEAIKTRPGAYGGSLSYLEGHTVIARLNEAFGGNWSFEVVTHEILDEEVLVLGRLRAESVNVVKMSFGSSRITKDDRTKKPIAIGDDLKAAATDALKKSATLLGVGLNLYGGSPVVSQDAQQPATPGAEHGNGSNSGNGPSNGGSNGNGRITNRQISAIFSIARQRGMTNTDVRAMVKEQFDRNLDYLTKADGSRLIEQLLGQ